jgi:cell division septation protein DedD
VTEQTILVIDADRDTEEKIVSTLEPEGYLVFAASGAEIISETAGKISPSLIFLKPSSNSVEGFEVCKKIHGNDAFKRVPIIVLASFRGSLDPRYTTFYGIIDYLKMPVSPAEVLDKTEKVFGVHPRGTGKHEEELAGYSEEESVVQAEEPAPSVREYSIETESVEKEIGRPVVQAEPAPAIREYSTESESFEKEIGSPSEDYRYDDEEEDTPVSISARDWNRPAKRRLVGPVLIAAAVITIAISGFLAYSYFFFPAEPPVRPPADSPSRLQQQEQPAVATEDQQEKSAEGDIRQSEPAVPPIEQAPQQTEEIRKSVKQFHSVQVGAFKSEDNALALASSYAAKGYEAFTQKGYGADKQDVYRVLVGKFQTRNEALQLSNVIREKEKVKSVVFKTGSD